MNSWVETGCTVLSAGVEESVHADTERARYRLEISFGYEYGGKRYVSERAQRLDILSGHREKVEGGMERYPVGSDARCWVNPERPGEAVLKRSSRGAIYTIWFPLLFLVGGAVMVGRGVGEKLKS
jgi:hypothetical protein